MSSSSRPSALNRWKKYTCANKSDEEKLDDFLKACRDGKEAVLKILLEKGNVDVNAIPEKEKEGQGLTALHLAVRHNHIPCVKLLIESCANVNATDNFGFLPIHDAALYGYADCLKVLLNSGAVVRGVDLCELGYITPLYYAVKHNYIDCVQVLEVDSKEFDLEQCDQLIWNLGSTNYNTNLLAYSKKSDFSDSELEKWLKNSAVTGNVEYFKEFKQRLENARGKTEDFNSKHGYLVIIATQHGHSNYLENLLQLNFDSNEANTNKSTALHYAARYGHADTIELLMRHGAAINAKNLDNWAPLHVAVRQNNMEAVQQLIKCGCDVNLAGGEHNDTPLHVALQLPVDPPTLREILAAKPSLLIKNDKDELPIDIVDKEDPLHEVLMEYIRN